MTLATPLEAVQDGYRHAQVLTAGARILQIDRAQFISSDGKLYEFFRVEHDV